MLDFDPVTHRYFWHGKPVPNVTRIIAPLVDYSRIRPGVLERARAEGIAIHRMVELDCRDDLDTDTLPEWMRGHYEAWCRFKDETGFEPLASEWRAYHEQYAYAGTADLFCLTPRLAKTKGVMNIDVKRSLFAGPAIGLQTAAYSELWNSAQPKDMRVKHRAALVLRPDGTYQLTQYEDREDWTAFLACLQQWRWKEKHYGTPD